MRRRKYKNSEIAPDEIFLDSSNLPSFNRDQFEGRIEKPISKRSLIFLGIFFIIVGGLYLSKLWSLQIINGTKYKDITENNRLHHSLIFSERGIINDRNGQPLVWNTIDPTQNDYVLRKYTDIAGTYNLLGYVKYPSKDKAGFYYNTNYTGMDGIEKYFDTILSGQSGLKITETDALGKKISENQLIQPKKGNNVTLSLDLDLQAKLYEYIKTTADGSGFKGGSGVIMDINTGEIISMVTYPEYNSNILTDGQDTQAINDMFNNSRNPFLDRVISGQYTPGSIMKPFFALAALNEGVISPDKKILSTGELRLPNPYKPGEYTVFKDWKANGWTNMEEAIAVSSDVYFYEIAGGFMDQPGLGITNIGKYARLFGFGDSIDGSFFTGKKGIIPSPEWKAKNFDGDIWRVGDTYNTGIGQYGFQVTPIQAVRAVAALANSGTLVYPTLLKGDPSNVSKFEKLPSIPESYYHIVREGMRLGVQQGTVKALDIAGVKIAAKTGTAQLGVSKKQINSLVLGFFPYEKPRYAFVVTMEQGPYNYSLGAPSAFRYFMDWLVANKSQYVSIDATN